MRPTDTRPHLREEIARAKVNLYLHVKGRRPDGYHELESLVVFADVCDRLAFEPGESDSLVMTGPFGCAVEGENLVFKAKKAVASWLGREIRGTFHLEKNIPVAAGLGGGSSDAAAAVRLLFRHFGAELPDTQDFADALATVGADVPVCLGQKAAFMRGLGERISKVRGLPKLPAVLVNPRLPLSTGAVFKALGARPCPAQALGEAPPFRADSRTAEEAACALANLGNDLEAPARALEPAVGTVLAAIAGLKGCRLARLSGSGPTCFGLFTFEAEAEAAAAELARVKPNWWVAATNLG